MSGREFREGLDMMAGKTSFTINSGKATGIEPPSGNRRFMDCTIESIPQPKGRKPHMAVKDRQGDIVFEVGAQQANAYCTLQGFEGQLIHRFAWEEIESAYGAGTYLQCKIQADPRRSIPEGYTPIPRIVIDTETTGLDPMEDEILQLSIIDGDGNTIIDRKYKPDHTYSWHDAERINHISPASVADRPGISTDLDEIQLILDRAIEVCVYNAEFDLAFIGELGLRMDLAKVTDTMREYGAKYHGTQYWRLEDAASECGYRYHAHDSLADCHATLVVQQRVDKDTGDSQEHVTHARQASAMRATGNHGRHGGSRKEKPVTRASYAAYSVCCWIFTALTAFVVLMCFFGPAMLIVAIPMVLLDIAFLKQRKQMKTDLNASQGNTRDNVAGTRD